MRNTIASTQRRFKKMTIKIIKNEIEYQSALKEIERLMDAEPGTPGGDLLELLSILVEKYEEEHFPIEAPDPISAIRERMQELDLRPVDLAGELGGRARVSELLSGKRGLSVNAIRVLHRRLNIPYEILLAN